MKSDKPEEPVSASYMEAVATLINKLRSNYSGQLIEPIRVYLVGGAAIHALTQYRVSEDLDLILSQYIPPPDDASVAYELKPGNLDVVYLDAKYNQTLGLLHPDYEKNAIPLNLDAADDVEIYTLSALDLAVTKIARFSERDREDIQKLIELELMPGSEDFTGYAMEALDYYIGRPQLLRYNIRDVAKWIDEYANERKRKRTSEFRPG